MSAAPLVSVVTPVYNGQDYLAECIDSVLRQTYSNWEYVILDNASTDDTASIAERYAAQDARIHVVHATEFLDAIPNHSRAARAIDSGSRYVKMLQADDWLYPECLERMVDVAERHPAVGVVSSFRLVGDRVDQQTPLPYAQPVMSGRAAVRWELLGEGASRWISGSMSTLLVRADFVRHVHDFYDPTVWNADTDAAYRVLVQSDLGFVHQILSYTRRHMGAQMAFDYRVWSFIARDGRLLIRYGPKLLSPPDYRAEIRKWLRRYATWLAKQSLKPARRRQREFQEFHRREIDYMLAEATHDRETRLVLLGCRRLLRATRSTQPEPCRD